VDDKEHGVKVLVTGGAGYIGSICSNELLKAGYEVVVFDNLYQGHRAAVPAGAEFVQGDLLNKDDVDRVFAQHKGIEGVLHFASYTLVGESTQKPFKYLRDNQVMGCNLFEAALANDVGRVLLSSTANLFDEPTTMPIEPDDRIVPGSPYGESKYMLERTLMWMERLYGMRYGFLRYFNAAGCTPEQGEDHDPETHIIPIVLQVALGQREKLTIFGGDYATSDGTCVRDYVHVVDLAQAHILTLEGLAERSRVYNLGNGHGFSIMQVIETAEKVTGREIPYQIGPRRPGDPPVLAASSERIRSELGWTPQYPTLEAIIASAWEWHLRNPHGYPKQ
jgi:UDP-glucose 4-epimerase